MKKLITESMLDELRQEVSQKLSQKRFYHTLCVEEMVTTLANLYCPGKVLILRAAALLHDITKEKTVDEQEVLCWEFGLPVTKESRLSPKTYHAMTAAALIERDYPAFADGILLSAVRWHTTGRRDMTIPEKLLYLADYIDNSRTYESCVALRNEFFDAKPETLSSEERLKLLRRVLIHSYQITMEDLLQKGALIASETVEAYNDLLLEEVEQSI